MPLATTTLRYPAADFAVAGSPALEAILAAPAENWAAPRHTAAALAWKHYGWNACQPLVHAFAGGRPLPLLGLHRLTVELGADPPRIDFDVHVVPVVDPDDLATAADELRAHLGAVIAALTATTPIRERALWGSVAESLCYGLCADPDLAAAQPDRGVRREQADRLLAAFGLADLVDIAEDGDGLAVRRRTCCLAFTAPGLDGMVCTTCCIKRRR